MNYRQDNKLSMYLAVQRACHENSSDWNTIPAAVRALSDLEQCIGNMQEGMRRQKRRMTGVSLNKRATRKAMTEKAFTIAQATVTYTHDTNNQSMAFQKTIS